MKIVYHSPEGTLCHSLKRISFHILVSLLYNNGPDGALYHSSEGILYHSPEGAIEHRIGRKSYQPSSNLPNSPEGAIEYRIGREPYQPMRNLSNSPVGATLYPNSRCMSILSHLRRFCFDRPLKGRAHALPCRMSPLRGFRMRAITNVTPSGFSDACHHECQSFGVFGCVPSRMSILRCFRMRAITNVNPLGLSTLLSTNVTPSGLSPCDDH